jgi:hypothetical protein
MKQIEETISPGHPAKRKMIGKMMAGKMMAGKMMAGKMMVGKMMAGKNDGWQRIGIRRRFILQELRLEVHRQGIFRVSFPQEECIAWILQSHHHCADKNYPVSPLCQLT